METFHLIPWPWPGTPEGFWDSSRELRVRFRQLFKTLLPHQRAQAKRKALGEIERYYDGHQVNFTAYIVVAAGFRG